MSKKTHGGHPQRELQILPTRQGRTNCLVEADPTTAQQVVPQVCSVPGKSPNGAMHLYVPQEPRRSRELFTTPLATVMTEEQRKIFQALTPEQRRIFRGIEA